MISSVQGSIALVLKRMIDNQGCESVCCEVSFNYGMCRTTFTLKLQQVQGYRSVVNEWLHDNGFIDNPLCSDGSRISLKSFCWEHNILLSSDIRWYNSDDKLHRLGKPAMVKGRAEYWYEDGKLHRVGGPAIIENGDRHYYVKGELRHIIWEDGSQAWYENGEAHRLGGPSFIGNDGSEHWQQNGIYHRLGGPAVTDSLGDKLYFINGKELSEENFNHNII